MADTINTIVDKAAYEQLERLSTSLKDTRLELVETLKAGNKGIKVKLEIPADLEKSLSGINTALNNINSAMTQAQQVQATFQKQASKVTAATQRQTKAITIQEKALRKEQLAAERLAISKTDAGKAAQKLSQAANEENRATRQSETFYGKVSLKLKQVAKEYKDLAVRKSIHNNLTEEEIERMTRLERKMDVYNAALKNADQRTGNFSRSVGNYKTAFDGMGFSVAQVTREFPAFAHSATTGFMAISNNIPMVVDEINKLRAANVQLANSGKPTKSVLKAVGAAIFSFQTILSVAIVALTVYGDELTKWIGRLIAGKEAINQHKLAVEALNKAYESSEVTGLIADLMELQSIITLAKEGLIDKKDAVDKYNEVLGTAAGEVDNLDDAETNYVNKAPAYIKAMLFRTAATIAAADAAKQLVENEKKIFDKEEEKKKVTAEGPEIDKRTRQSRASQGQFTNLYTNAAKQKSAELDDEIDELEKDGEDLIDKTQDIVDNFNKKAAEIANKFGLDMFGGDDDEPNGGRAEKRGKLESILVENKKVLEGSIEAYEILAGKIKDSMKAATDPIEYQKFKDQLENVMGIITVLKNEFENIDEDAMKLQLEIQSDDLQFNLNSKIPQMMDFLANRLGENSENLMDEFLSQYEWDYANFIKFSEKKIKQSEKEAEEKRKIMEDYVAASAELLLSAGDLAIALTERKIAAIEEEQRSMNEAYDDQLARENLTEEQRKGMEKEREQRNKELDEKKRKEQRKNAKIAKAQAAFTIALTTTQAVLAALAPPPIGLGPIAGVPLAAITAGFGALQLAAALAQPLPAYATGKSASDSYEGAMLWGEKRPEIKVSKDGMVEMATRPTIGTTKKGDTIYKSVDDFKKAHAYDEVINASILTSLAGNEGKTVDMASLFDEKLSALRAEMKQGIKEGFNGVAINLPKSANNVNELARLLRNQKIADV